MKLIKGKNASRGFTLVELIVVMGLSLMVLTLMVTMLTIFTAKVDQNKAYHGFYDEVAMCRDEIQKFISNNDFKDTTNNKSAVISVQSNTANGSILTGSTGTVKLYGSEFSAPGLSSVYFKYIDRIEFTVYTDLNYDPDDDADTPNSIHKRILLCKFIGSYGKDDASKGTHKTEFSQSMLFILESDGATFKLVP